MKEYKEQLTKVRKARIKMLGEQPFFGGIAFGMPIKFDTSIKTAATDGEQIIFNPKFVDVLTPNELVFVTAHEVMHPAFMHTLRRGNRDPAKWNVACDIVVNYVLKQSRVGQIPQGAWDRPDLYHLGHGRADEIYDLLPPGDYGEPGSGMSGGGGSLDEIVDADPANAQNLAAKWRNKMQQGLQAARQAGKVSGELESMVEQLTVPKVTWQDRLRNFVMTTRGQDRTWAKPNRRYMSSGLKVPGRYGEQMGEFAFFIDCSGSTSNRMISQCSAEINSIKEELRPEQTHVVYFDTEVKKHEAVSPDDPLDVKAYGRGGTCFRTSFEYIEQQGIELTCAVVATDLECDDYGPQPPYPVLWLVMEGSHYAPPPWGEVLEVN